MPLFGMVVMMVVLGKKSMFSKWEMEEGGGGVKRHLTQGAHRVVDVARRACPVHVDGSDDKLVFGLGYEALQNHGVALDGLADVRPLCVHFRPG